MNLSKVNYDGSEISKPSIVKSSNIEDEELN